MSKVKFKYGTAEQLANAPYLEGTFYVISDDNSTDGILYADLHGNRICFGDVASLVKKVSKLESSAQDTKFEVDWLRSNIIKNTTEKDTTITADDAHTVPPQEVVIYGKSEQNGTPTPITPISIDSLDNKFTLHVAKNGITDYGDWPIMFDLGSYILRSLPDGTCDTLRMSYSKPSEDAGWAMYDTTLEQTIASIALADLEWTQLSNGIFQGKNIPNSANGIIGTHQILCDTYQEIETQSNSADMIGNDDKTIAFQSDYPYIFVKDTDYTNLDDFIASLGTSVINYPLATPIVHSLETVEFLGTVELPVLPNPMTAWVDDGNVQPDISMTYEVDNKIFSSNLIHAETDVSLDDIRDRINALENIDEILTNRLIATEADIDSLEVTKANIDSLEAAEARIDELEVSSATIQNLEATNARIGDLETDNLAVKRRLTAAEADIGNLEAVNVNVIGRLRATEADIEELTASKATVDDLIAVNANIQELEAANATITGKLTAAEASIEDLEAENATITGTLTAAQASIEDLEATNATITGRLEANEASIEDLEAANVTITGRLEANEADIDTLTASKADITDLNAATARIGSLETDNVDVKGRLSATEADIENLEATTATIESLNAAEARIGTLETDKANVTDLTAATGRIGTLEANTADIATIRANSAKVANLTAQELEADHATIGSLDANYAQINMANVNNAWIQNGTVKDGAISNAMINSVSANKLTAGTIDASNITVTNLNADNITTGTINGQRIGAGSLSLDKLEENVYTEDEVNSIVDNLQNQIDGAIETWTGTEIPTLSNTPASDWTTNSIKDKHVGDIYFIVNSQSDQNGYNYRFTKIGNTYSWQLIKDSDVTQVLQRLTDAEGKIGDIEQFDTTISSWKNDTDEELRSIKSAATTLAGRVTTAEGTLQTKVDTTTFNTLSQTVDGHSSSITQLTTETTTLTQAVDTLNTKTSSDSGNIVQFDDSIGFKEIVVHGKSMQASCTGKNLLNPQHFNSRAPYVINENNSITIKSSDGASWDAITPLTLSAGTYTISWKKQHSGQVQIRTSEDNYSSNIIAAATDDYKNFTLTSDGGVKIKFGISLASPYYPYTEYAQLETGSIATTYEPYVDIKPSPNSDYPQEIESVDKIALNVVGKNLLDISKWELYNDSGISINEDEGSLQVAQRAYQELKNRCYLPFKKKFKLSFDYEVIDAGTGQGFFWLQSYNEDDYRVAGIRLDATTAGVIKHAAGTVPSDATYLSFGTWSYSAIVRIFNIQLELGDYHTDYESYQGQSIDIPLGDHQIRSLPDGTDDTLTFSYIGPSIREGWGLYNAELVQNIYRAIFNGSENWIRLAKANDTGYYFAIDRDTNNPLCVSGLSISQQFWSHYIRGNPYDATTNNKAWIFRNADWNYNTVRVSMPDEIETVNDFKNWLSLNNVVVDYILANPIIHSLGVVELPLSEDLNLWASTSPFTTIDATWWHEAGRVEKNAIDISNASNDLYNTKNSTILPKPYRQVEWVEFCGKQFIRLDWRPGLNGVFGFDVDFITYNSFNNGSYSTLSESRETNETRIGAIFGVRGSGATASGKHGPTYTYYALQTYSGYGVTNGFVCTGGQKIDAELYTDKRRQQCSLLGDIYTAPDGTQVTVDRSGYLPSNGDMYVGAIRTASGTASPKLEAFSSTRIYSLKFYDDTTLVLDLVPAVRKMDNVGGLYDKVNEMFYPSIGTLIGDVLDIELGKSLTITEKDALSNQYLADLRTGPSRLITVQSDDIKQLIDGQEITFTSKYPTASQTYEAVGITSTSYNPAASNGLVLRVIDSNGDMIGQEYPIYYNASTNATTQYDTGQSVTIKFCRNVVFNTTATPNGWFADANYDTNTNTNDTFTRLTDNAKAGLNGLKRYTLCMRDENGFWTSIVNEDNVVAMTKTCYTGGLMPSKVCYHATNAPYEPDAKGGVLWESYGTIDFRYSLNIGTTAATGLVQMTPIYLVGTISSTDGLFYLDTEQWWTQNPQDEDKIYIFISQGRADYYRSWLAGNNPMYIVSDGELVEYTYSRITRNTNKINETIDTVDEHTRKIGVLETTVENKADGSDLTTISNRLNTVSDTVDGHTQSISSLNSTMATKADSSSVETVSNRVNSISDTVDGHTQSISSINSTVATKADSSTVTTLSNNVNSISETVDGHTQSISSLNTTIATKADGSALTTVSNKVNTISDTVDEHSQSISSINTTLDTKADGSALTTVSNKLNTVSDTVDGHTQSISSINETLETKVDSSTVSSLTTKVNNISDTVDGHTQTIGSVQNTQTQMQGKLNKTIVETTQLWYSKANTEAPAKPTSQITSTSTDGNAWRIVVPVYNASYPNYFYCYQWKYTDGTYGWSGVTRDIATGESQERARTAITDASSAVSTAASAQATAESASTNANQAKENASSAVSLANTASTNASSALSTANTASSNASTALSTANSAASDASSAVSTANTAKATADKNVKTSLQLWFTKANETAPNKPTTRVTSTSTDGNAWRVVVPTYSVSYPYYFYCYQYELADGTYTWSDVVYDRATTENQSNSRNAVTGVSTLTTKTNTISDTVDQHSQSISSLNTTVATKADNSTVTTLSNNLSTLEQDVNTFKTTVSSTYSTKNELAEVQDDISDLQAGSKLSDTKSGNIIVIDDALAAPPISVEVYGKSTQIQTTGKNLFDPTLFESFENVTDLGNGIYAINTPLATIANKHIWDNPGLTGPHYVSYEYRFNQGATAAGAEMYVHYIDGTTYRMGNTVANINWRSWGVYIADMADVDYFYVTHNKSTQTFWRDIQIVAGSTAQDWEPYTGGSSAPSPAYPQTIFSMDECVVHLHGKNLIDQSTLEQGSWGTESKTTSTTRCRIPNLLPVIPSTTYTFSGICVGRTFNWYIREFNANGVFYKTQTSWSISGESVTIGPNTKYICVMVRASDDSDVIPSDFSNLQLELGSTATDYEPYISQTIDIPLEDHIARSLPDGTRDELTLSYLRPSTREGWGVFSKMLTQYVGSVDMGTLTWSPYEPKGTFYTSISDRAYGANSSGMTTIYGNAIKIYSSADIDTYGDYKMFFYASGTNVSVHVKDSRFTVAADCKDAVSGVMLYYALATPVTITLDPIELPILSNPLTAWAEGGSVQPEISVDYWLNNAADIVPHLLDLDAVSKNNITAIESRVHTAESTIDQHSESIALKANSSDVYTKTQSDGLIATEVTNRNAAIKAATDAIELSVSETYTTKTEFNNLELGGRNYALNSAIVCDKISNGGSEYFAYDLGQALPFGEGTPIVISFDLYMEVVTTNSSLFTVYNTNNKGPHEVIIDTRPFQGRTISVGDIIDERVVIIGTVRRDRTDANKDHDWLEFYSNYGSNNLYRISNLKLEKGTKATDWTPAPEDIATDLVEAKAAIKLTTDGIATEVSKINSAKYVNASAPSWTLSAIKLYAAEDRTENWNVASTTGFRVGDTVYVKGTDSTRNCPIYVKTTVTSINSATNFTGKSHGYEDMLPVDSAISTINQSAESIKIQASKVEIDGTAIFTNSDFQSQLSNQNYATTTQVATAKSEAISTAATDATNKANTAQQNAIDLIPTDISELNNDAGYQTSSDVDTTITSKGYQTSSQVESAITSKGYATTTQAQGYASTAEQNAKTYAEGQASTVNSSLEAYKTSTNSTLTALQNQVDGQIEAWYKSTDPTTSNEPASTWNTDALKARHEGDIYYNVENGHSWRWMKSGNTYSWQQIPDSDAAAALAAAQNAQTLANSKRRIFTLTPVPPYDIGDLWVNGSSIQYCSTSKSETQTYAESDWTLTATDDSGALAAINTLNNQLGTIEAPYREVEWVESDGRAFVMLDWKPNPDNWGFEIDFSTIDKFNSGHSTGALDKKHTSSTDYAGSIFGTCDAATSSNDYRLGTYDYSDGVLRSGNNNKYHGKLYSDGRRQQCSLRGNIYTGADGSITTITRNGVAPKWNMVIFGNTQSGSSLWCTNPCSARIYSLKFYDGDTLAVDLVGAYRKSDGCTGFWDKVKKHFYPAAGMTYGSVVNDIGEIPTILSKILNISPQLVTNNIAATRLWTADTNEISELADGQQIILRNRFGTVTEAQTSELAYYLDSGSSNNVYLKLTLSDNTETDWIPCYYSNTGRLTTHYGAGSEIRLVYRENVVSGTSALIRGWWADANYDTNTNDNARYIQWYNNIYAKAALRNASIICGTDEGYCEIGNGVSFDLMYPILWRTAALKINATDYQYSWTLTYDRTLATCYPAASFPTAVGIKNQILYLVGTLNGSTFTCAQTFLTFVEPTTDDGLIYIPIGKLGNQSTGQNYLLFSTQPNPNMFMYLNGKFQQVSSSTTVATQKLYYRTTSLTAPTAPTTWITTNNVATYNAWNLAVPPLAASTAENATKYPYLYSVEQQKRVDGTVITGAVSNDSNTTIIDGGSIITNSVTATQIAAGTITANEISSGAITTDKLDANAVTAAKIDATDLHVSAANIDGTITFGQLSGVQASGDYALSSNIPQNISDLNNDTGFITSASVPTKVSDLTNDSGFQTSSQVDTAITSKGYATTGYADGKASAAEQAAKSYAETQAGAVQTALNTEINQRKAQYGTSSTAAGTVAKAVTCANFELEVGNEITVKFTTANTSAAKVQLNVNSKGAKDIWVGNAVTSASNQLLWGANAYITFKYDGTQFQVIGEPRTWYGACTTAQATAAKAATITGCVVCKGAKVELAMTYANSAASPTLNVSFVGAKNIYFGTGTTQPLISNGTSWLQSNTATFTFDGAVWRTQGKTYIDANSIVTGYISADRIEAGSISGDKITGGTLAIGAFPETTQTDILNSNIHVPSTVAELEDSSDYATKTYAEEYAEEYADGKDSAIAAAAKRTDVSIAVTAINYTNNTATLQATLYIDGTATTSGVTYKWLKDGTVISGQTSRTLSVTSAMGLSHVYSCTVTYS